MAKKALAKPKKTPSKANTAKTKPFRQDTATGKIVSQDRVEKDKAGTVTQTVNKDNDGVRTDKGGTHQKRATAEETAMREFEPSTPLPELPAATNPPEQTEAQPAVECLTDRPNRPRGYTCLDEMKEAVEHPERFTDPQLSEILSENNLCANCRAQYDAEVSNG